jgi:hypothetical protein
MQHPGLDQTPVSVGWFRGAGAPTGAGAGAQPSSQPAVRLWQRWCVAGGCIQGVRRMHPRGEEDASKG